MPSDLVMLHIAAGLAAWLFFRLSRRARTPLSGAYWDGRGIDVTCASSKLQCIRSFSAQLHRPSENSRPRKGLLASARKAIVQLSYFQGRDGTLSRAKNKLANAHSVHSDIRG